MKKINKLKINKQNKTKAFLGIAHNQKANIAIDLEKYDKVGLLGHCG